MDEIAFDDKVSRPGIGRLFFPRLFRVNPVDFDSADPLPHKIGIAVMPIKPMINVVELDPLVGCNDADVEHIFFVQNMVEFAVIFALHPHAASALVQGHVGHREEEHWL